MTTTLKPGDTVYHRTRREHGTWIGYDDADHSGATSWVDFGDDDIVMVSTHLLDLR